MDIDWTTWRAATRDPDVRADLAAILRRADERATYGSCALSGRCCRFDEYGHRLWATGLEIAYAAGETLSDAPCPFQVDGMCGIREHRPLGCRVFYCNSDKAAQRAAHAEASRELVEMHQRHGIAFERFEWRRGLRLAGVAA